ncbi:MAG: signal peptide prediction [Steroidobacteraceae bacterium]
MIGRLAAYAWATPNSLIGLIAGIVILCFGGRMQRVRGAIEFSGGLIASWVTSEAVACRYHAITLGHAILGTDETALSCAREHEHVHVRQYERWGPFFLPAYFASSAWQIILGRSGYRDNCFEREAFATEARRKE